MSGFFLIHSRGMFWTNKVVWITGASSGIGEALVRRLDGLGARIILSARNTDRLKEIADQLSGDHLILQMDLEHSSEFNLKVDEVMKKYGRIDVLVNNGGMSQRSNAIDTSLEIDRKIMEVNYFGNIALTKAVLPIFHKQKEGRVLVISSISGKFGFFLRSAYSASKHALHGFYESLRLEEEKNGLQITIACPGKINTDISVNALDGSGSKHGVMDHNQATGMSADECARQLVVALEKGKREVLIGNKEIKAVLIKRLFPKLFHRIIRKQSAT